MSADEERFMAFEGLVQWTSAAIEQGDRVASAQSKIREVARDVDKRRIAALQFQTECHYFAIAANKVFEHRDWALKLGLCANIDFTMLGQFSRGNIRDLRNMREHVVDYFEGVGRDKSRWEIETPEFKADATAVVGPLIGGRLDWALFVVAAKRLLPALLAGAILYPNC